MTDSNWMQENLALLKMRKTCATAVLTVSLRAPLWTETMQWWTPNNECCQYGVWVPSRQGNSVNGDQAWCLQQSRLSIALSTISGYLPSNYRGKIERGKKINLLNILNIYTESPSKGLSMAMLLHYWNMFPSFLGEFIPSQLHAPLLPLSSPQGLGWFDHLRFASCSEVTCRSYELPSIPMDSCSANETNLS